MNIEELLERAKNSEDQLSRLSRNQCFCGKNINPSLYLPTKKSDKEDENDGLNLRIYLYCDACKKTFKRCYKRQLNEKELFTLRILCQ